VLKMMDPYAVLDVSRTATPAEITHAYRHKLRSHHPDTRSQTSPDGADERLRDIVAAYAVLRDPKRRAEYDRTLDLTAPSDVQGSGSIKVQVSRSDSPGGRPPLWAGPVRWHR
jgi:DnaJ-class molecular chaperone